MEDRSIDQKKHQSAWQRLDKRVADLNAFLCVIAIGLAVLDLSCYWALKLNEFSHPAAAASASPAAAARVARPATQQTAAYLVGTPPSTP